MTAPAPEPPAWTVSDCAGHQDDMVEDVAFHVVGCTCARPGGAS